MALTVGKKLPNVSLHTKTEDSVEEINLLDWCGERRVVFFNVPGAFTQTCTNTHLPGFVRLFDTFAKKAVDVVACISVNDAHVMKAWGEQVGALGKIEMLAENHMAELHS